MVRGRKPKTKEQTEHEGGYDKNPQNRRPDEPDLPPGWPEMPDHLDELGQAVWREICGIMAQMRTLSPAFAKVIERYCVAYSKWRLCLKEVNATGPVVESVLKDGRTELKRSPHAMEMHKWHEELIKMEAELGLTPASKARVAVVTGTQSQEDEFFGGPRLAGTG